MFSRMAKCLVLRRFGDGVCKPASEHVDLPLVARRIDVAGDRRAVDADGDRHHVARSHGPSLDDERNLGVQRSSAERHFAARRGVGPVGE